jgi:iron complex transport system permease protein
VSKHRWLLVAAVLALALVIAVIVALRTGVAASTNEIIWNIRAPRVAMALLVGGGLGLAGVLMQGSLGNPLADPGLVGVSAGAALGAVIAVTVGASFNTGLTAAVACIGAAIATVIIVAVSMRDRRPEVVTLLLAGVAVTAFAIAALALMASMSTNAAVRSITFWSSGSLSLSTWSGVVSVAPFVLVGIVLAWTVARPLDVMSLGDRAAMATGVNVTRIRYLALIAVVLLVAAGVAVVGVIAFVGLLVPHAVRMMAGPRHAPLLVLSALAGALLILLADTLARVAANPLEIPIGAITAVIGAPVFFVLIRRTRAKQGGWA